MKWFSFAKAQKEIWAKISKCDSHDMPPFVIAEREEEPIIIVLCPQVDKELGFQAAALCRRGMACDALTFITDGWCLRPGKVAPENWEEIYEEIRDKYDSLGDAFADGNKYVGEALTAIRCTKENKFTFGNSEYVVEGKKVYWTDHPSWEEDDGGHIEGVVPDTMKHIMGLPTIFDMEILQNVAGQLWEGMSEEEWREKQLHHAGRAIRRVLHEKDYLILECVKWNPDDGYDVLLRRMMDKWEEIDGVYDLENMKTRPEYLKRFEGEN